MARRAERRADPDIAWVAGLLAPLGWLAACAIDLDAVGRCLENPKLAQGAHAVQQRFWGLDHSAIARRLSRRLALAWLGRGRGRASGSTRSNGADARGRS